MSESTINSQSRHDWFAGQALQGLLANPSRSGSSDLDLAFDACRLADSVMLARDHGNPPEQASVAATEALVTIRMLVRNVLYCTTQERPMPREELMQTFEDILETAKRGLGE